MATSLDDRHIADLHALAAEIGIERYRMLGRPELVDAILDRNPDAAASLPPAPESTAVEDVGSAAPADTDTDAPQGDRPRSRRGGRGGGRQRSGGGGRTRRDGDTSIDEEGEAEEDDPGDPISGVLDITPRGHGFIRLSGLESDEGDVYVSPSQIRRCEMQRGDEVAGPARKPRRGERYPALVHVDMINGVEPGTDKPRLGDATPIHPSRRIALQPAAGASKDQVLLLRAVELLNPLAFGQRVLVRATAGSGRTTLLRTVAASLAPRDDLELVVLLIDERPEEVEAWREAAPGADLAIATAEMRPGEQLRLVELAFGRASRRAEAGADVVMLVDSLSRIEVAADDPGRAKPIFGAGRETEEEAVGSLTVLATTLGAAGEDAEGDEAADGGGVDLALETTETSLIVLDRNLATAGVYPAIDAAASRLAGEEHLRDEAELVAIRSLRAALNGLPAAESAAILRERIQASPDNVALLASAS